MVLKNLYIFPHAFKMCKTQTCEKKKKKKFAHKSLDDIWLFHNKPSGSTVTEESRLKWLSWNYFKTEWWILMDKQKKKNRVMNSDG